MTSPSRKGREGGRERGREGGRAYLTEGRSLRVGQEDFNGDHDGAKRLVQGPQEVDHA